MIRFTACATFFCWTAIFARPGYSGTAAVEKDSRLQALCIKMRGKIRPAPQTFGDERMPLSTMSSPTVSSPAATPTPLPPARPNADWHDQWEKALQQKDVETLEALVKICPYHTVQEKTLYRQQLANLRQPLNRQLSEDGGYLELDAARMTPPRLPPRNPGMKTPPPLSRTSSTSSGYGSARDFSSPSVSRQSSLETRGSLDERYAALQKIVAEDPELLGQKPKKAAKSKRGGLSRKGAVRRGSTHSVDSGVSMGSARSQFSEKSPSPTSNAITP